MNRLILFLLSIFLLSSCSNNIDDYEVTTNDTSTEYVYSAYSNYTFSKNSTKNKIPDLFLNSIELMFGIENPSDKVVIDYNNDGFFDLVHTDSDYMSSYRGVKNRKFITFYKGDEYGNLSLDVDNSNKFKGLIHGIKGITVDVNEDGYLDLFFAGTGLEYADAGPEVIRDRFEYPILLINNGDGTFDEHRLESLIGYWHGVTSGDLNNDGNSEIVLVSPEDGAPSVTIDFTTTPIITQLDIPWQMSNGKWSQEVIDINNDGYDDLIMASDGDTLSSDSFVWLNSSSGFGEILYIPKNEYETVTDINFFDIDSDGDLDLILSRNKMYQKAYIQIIENNITHLTDVTDTYIDNDWTFEGGAIEKLYIGDNDNDGIVELRTHRNGYVMFEWEFIDNKFIKIN